jgi:MAF protein
VRRLAAEKSARAIHVLAGVGSPDPLLAGDGGLLERQRRWKPGAKAEGGSSVGEPYDLADGVSCVGQNGTTLAEQDIVVLGADTAVVLDGAILGKPRDDEDARAMLGRLSGRRHEVLTGVSLRTAGEETGLVEATSVWFARLTPDAIAWYVSTGEGRDKAGGYAIQGLASRWIPRIEGSYSNVVGLPVTAVAGLLQELNRTHPG